MSWTALDALGERVDAELHADFLPPDATPRFSGKGVEAELSPSGDACGCKYHLSISIAAEAELGTRLLTVPDSSGNTVALGFSVSDGPEVLETTSKSAHLRQIRLRTQGKRQPSRF